MESNKGIIRNIIDAGMALGIAAALVTVGIYKAKADEMQIKIDKMSNVLTEQAVMKKSIDSIEKAQVDNTKILRNIEIMLMQRSFVAPSASLGFPSTPMRRVPDVTID